MANGVRPYQMCCSYLPKTMRDSRVIFHIREVKKLLSHVTVYAHSQVNILGSVNRCILILCRLSGYVTSLCKIDGNVEAADRC